MNPMIEVFDGANMSEVCSRRSATVVPTQAFSLLNSDFTHKTAEHFADRIIEMAGPDVDKQLDLAFLSTLARRPTDTERSKYKTHVFRQARQGIAGQSGRGVIQPERVSLSGLIMNFELARRRFLYQSLTGVGGLALADVMRGATCRDQSAGAEDARPHAESEVVHLSDDARRREPDGFVRSQTGVGEVRQHGDGLEQGEEHRPGEPVRQAAVDSPKRVSVPEVRAMRARRFEPVSAHRDLRRRYGVCALHPDRERQSSGSGVSDEHRRSDSGQAEHGSWITYGLGTENQNLPAFVVLPDFRSLPFSGSQQWGAGFLPASYQGTVLRWKGDPILNLKPPAGVTTEEQSKQMELLRAYNQGFAEMHESNPDLQGRIDAYELAYRMQAEVPGVLDMAAEPAETLEMYGLNDPVTESFGKRCLMARQMVEKGVRFVQLYTPSQSWDGHTEIVKNHTKNAAETDKPIAALLKDLKRRGLLDSTLVVWMGEFGRTPDNPADLRNKAGRDHNTRAMTIWMAGGGIKPGALVGSDRRSGLQGGGRHLSHARCPRHGDAPDGLERYEAHLLQRRPKSAADRYRRQSDPGSFGINAVCGQY